MFLSKANLTSLRGWLAAVALLLLTQLLVGWRFAPPPPEPADAATDRFSAARAELVLRELLGDGAPHPTGSRTQEHLRERLLLALETMGYAPELQRGVECSRWGACAEVVNVVATLPGAGDDRAILLASHYDSVAAGPGAGDDGAGVAAMLEVARALKLDAPRRHGVTLLFSDGEEAGLLGAELFMREHPLARQLRVAINLEARGSAGPSLMFETGDSSAALASWLTALERPLTSSLFSAVYKRMPNDTDFSVFRDHGLTGYNFAFIDEVAHYHTPLDDLEHLSRGSLQHHGDNALALVRRVADADLDRLNSEGEAVWFDWLGVKLFSWPLSASLALALAGALAWLVVLVVRLRRRGRRALVGALAALGAALATLVLAVAVGFAAMWLIGLRGATPWVAYPAAATVALAAIALAAASLAAGWLQRIELWARHDGVWLMWCALAIAVSLWLPEASYLAVVPLWAAGVTAAAALALRLESTPSRRRRAALALALVPLFVTASLWLPTAAGLSMAIGLMGHSAISAALALCFTSAIPVLAEVEEDSRRRGAAVAGVVAALAVVVALLVPVYSARRPARLSITHLQRPDGASWIVDTTWADAPDRLRQAGELGAPIPSPLPLVGFRDVVTGPAPSLSLEPPLLERIGTDGEGALRVRVRSPRGADMIALLIRPDAPLASARVQGHIMPIRHVGSRSPWYPDHQMVTFLSAPAKGLVLQLSFAGPVPETIAVVDVAYGLPPEAQSLLQARGPTGTASQSGDLSILVSPAKL